MIGTSIFPAADAAEWTPDALAGAAYWFDARRAETVSRAAGGTVTGWREGVSAATALEQANPAYRPDWSTGAIAFTTDDLLSGPDPVGAGSPFTLAVRLTGSPGQAWTNPLSFGQTGLKLTQTSLDQWRIYTHAGGLQDADYGAVDAERRFVFSSAASWSFVMRDAVIIRDEPASGGGLLSDGVLTVGARTPEPVSGWAGAIVAIALLPRAVAQAEALFIDRWLRGDTI